MYRIVGSHVAPTALTIPAPRLANANSVVRTTAAVHHLAQQSKGKVVTEALNDLLIYSRQNGRVCPLPNEWNNLWKLLPQRSRGPDGSWTPHLPLILGAWWTTSDAEKQACLELHLRWAADHSALLVASNFLRALRPDQWHYAT